MARLVEVRSSGWDIVGLSFGDGVFNSMLLGAPFV